MWTNEWWKSDGAAPKPASRRPPAPKPVSKKAAKPSRARKAPEPSNRAAGDSGARGPKLQKVSKPDDAAHKLDGKGRFEICPACDKSVHVHALNHHLDLECQGRPSADGAAEPAADPGGQVDCPLCGRKVGVGVINAHIDSNCDDDGGALTGGGDARSRMASTLQKMREELTCSICLDVFDDPACLPCGHQFCRVCITEAFERLTHECPHCKQTCRKKSIVAAPVIRNLVAQWRDMLCSAKQEADDGR
ncbi:hypothetical protein M885DRAFT_523818 [Pelagophyceae sp. CCMP2097]|nr:hypothetical protein M885DRAFT_523818 [Pelagophyceae sp. CCMP2097]